MHDEFFGRTILLTGAAGFLGSHLTDRLLSEGATVVGVDNFLTGNDQNLMAARKNPKFSLIEADVSEPPAAYLPSDFKADFICHLASPASPQAYQHNPVATYKVNAFGTHYLLEAATEMNARFLFTTTSEIYGEPLEHPQKETYWGNVNPVGPRACYDESKRFGEMATSTFCRQYKSMATIVRIFNTYGPRMAENDGRAIPALITAALKNKPLTINGDGSQTRSFCFVDDLIEYLHRALLLDTTIGEVINIGNPDEHSINELAHLIKTLTNSQSEITYQNRPADDPSRRKPDITKAQSLLGYLPRITLEAGLIKTIDYFRQRV